MILEDKNMYLFIKKDVKTKINIENSSFPKIYVQKLKIVRKKRSKFQNAL